MTEGFQPGGASRSMRVVVITAHGGADVLEVRTVARPVAEGNHVLVRVRAAALNRADVLQRMGRYPAPAGAPQDVPGLEFAGEIESVGAASHRWRAGQRVFGIAAGGAQAEFISVPEDAIAEIPSGMDYTEAAAVPEAFITAHDALFTQGELAIGEAVAIHAVGSGVGLAAVQLAHAAGARTIGTARTASKLERAKEYGLDAGVHVADDTARFVEAAGELTDGEGVRLVVDLVGASMFRQNLEALATRGRLVLVGSLGGSRAEMDWGVVMRKRLRITGTILRSRSTEEKACAVRLFAEQVVPLFGGMGDKRPALRPVIDGVFEMADVRRAHERMESNESFGKIVLRVA